MFEALAGRKPEFLDWDQYSMYAVIAPFLPDTKEFLFQVRSSRLKNQPGEICFPGGHMEEGETPAEAGVRETTEELLVTKESVEVIAPLDIYMAPYHRVVYPFLGQLRDYKGTFCKDEVQEVFTVPFDFFLSTEPTVYYNQVVVDPTADFPYHLLGRTSYPWGKSAYPVLFYEYGQRVIWGMTARFVYNIVTLYRQQEE